jgi:hypothetical protein
MRRLIVIVLNKVFSRDLTAKEKTLHKSRYFFLLLCFCSYVPLRVKIAVGKEER